MNTYEVPEYAQLAFHYANKDDWFSIDKIIVPFPVQDYAGKYRVGAALDRFKYYSGELSKEGYPMSVAVSDAFVEWETNPCGLNFHLQKRDLKNFRNFGYVSEAEMLQRHWEDLATFVKINREVKGVALIEDANNYDSGQIHAIGAGGLGAVWSNKTTGTPINDVAIVKRANKWITDMAFNWLTLTYLMEHPTILDAATGSGPAPNMLSPREEQLSWLSRIFGLRCHVFMADAVQNSTAPFADQATAGATTIWGNYAWFGRVDTESAPGNLKVPTWAHEYVYQPEGAGYMGFIANETIDERAGLHGFVDLDLGYDNQNKVYAKPYGAKITGLY